MFRGKSMKHWQRKRDHHVSGILPEDVTVILRKVDEFLRFAKF